MSISGLMRTSASGMSAQESRLGTVADNIANSNTTGYKRASTEFSALVNPNQGAEYSSGGVESTVRYAIGEQGTLSFTSSVTDLAVDGDGFFVVNGLDGETLLTRAGSFVLDGEGALVNAAGYSLMGYDLDPGDPSVVANGTAGLEVINVGDLALRANPSTEGNLTANFPSNAEIVAAADLPSTNSTNPVYTDKTSLVAYDNLGNDIIVDVYLTKTAAETWEVAVYNRADATSGVRFPYSTPAIVTETLTFDPANGNLDAASPTSIDIAVPDGATVKLDLKNVTQLATGYAVSDVAINGNSPSEVDRITISDDGLLIAVFENGSQFATHRIPLADVASPDNLRPLAGDVFALGIDSGDLQVGFAREGGLGSVVSGALEQSNVDLANELTTMIESQRNYTANSKVFQTGADLLDVLVNLKR